MKNRVAVIGAGIAGLTAAHALQTHGHEVRVFDKGRGPGGRVSRRRAEQDLAFDHGAQYFVARDPRYKAQVKNWENDGIVRLWQPRLHVFDESGGRPHPSAEQPARYVGSPGMNKIATSLAVGLDCQYSTRIVSLEKNQSQALWRLSTAEGVHFEGFSSVLLTAPAPQSRALLEDHGPLADSIASVTMLPTWAVMLAYDEPLDVAFDAAFVNHGPLSWIARNNSKPGRALQPETWVLHATHAWSQENLEMQPEQVVEVLIHAFVECSGHDHTILPRHQSVHRWSFAAPDVTLEERCLLDVNQGLAVAGDWCGEPRVEGAYLSGLAAAEELLKWSDSR